MSEVIVIGGGPAGMMAAATAAEMGARVTLYEQNEKLGKKLYITGKGRCNITNDSDVESHMANMVSNSKFMYSSYYTFDAYRAVDFFNRLGLKTKVERGNRVFPVSDKSSDVIAAMEKACRSNGVNIQLNTKVDKLAHDGETVMGVYIGKNCVRCDKVIVATGGASYRMTGATGDGYKFARNSGHRVVEPVPSLVPLETKEQWARDLQGLSLKNVALTLFRGNKTYYEGFGEMLFTHFGISGPLVLTGSAYLGSKTKWPMQVSIDMKPKLSPEQLDQRLLRDFDKYNRKNFENALSDLLPKRMIPVVIELSGIDPQKKVDQITKEERHALRDTLKGMPLTALHKRSFNEAIITQGGVHIKDVNPNTMESKKIKGLYFVGEVMDLDALTGGFNLQIAYSTAYLAGISVIE